MNSYQIGQLCGRLTAYGLGAAVAFLIYKFVKKFFEKK